MAIQVTYRRTRRLSMRIVKNGDVHVSAPIGMPNSRNTGSQTAKSGVSQKGPHRLSSAIYLIYLFSTFLPFTMTTPL